VINDTSETGTLRDISSKIVEN